MRIGTGFDLHRLGADRPLRLGGVEIPQSPGLVAHSDGDVVLHAITDALLGAAGEGDLGRHFPDDREEYKNADSAGLLATVLDLVRAQRLAVVNVDCTVLAERPQLAPFRDRMEDRIAEVLGLDPARVNVKFTTMEGLGPIGEGRAIACQAACLLQEIDEPA